MITKRLVNCDFLNTSSFISCLSNKAKLLYFLFLTNADDKGFVGNAKDLAETLDRCEETFENTLFAYKYVDAIDELVNRRLVYEFSDKCGNRTYLIRHWFYHNKNQQFLSTNYENYLERVELINNEYHLKNHQEEEPYKEKEIKENKNKTKSLNIKNVLDKDNNEVLDNTKVISKDNWDKILDDIEEN